jgi:thymidine phosphorylase
MDQPLASAAGNAVEVRNAVDFLTGTHRDARLLDVTLALAAEMLLRSGRAASHGEAADLARDALDSGAATEKFQAMVTALGGPADFVEAMDRHLPKAAIVRDIKAPQAGTVLGIDTRGVGLAVVTLGGGRRRAADKVDHAVGLDRLVALGTVLQKGDPIARVHARTENEAAEAEAAVIAAYTTGEGTASINDAVMMRIAD